MKKRCFSSERIFTKTGDVADTMKAFLMQTPDSCAAHREGPFSWNKVQGHPHTLFSTQVSELSTNCPWTWAPLAEENPLHALTFVSQ